MGPCAAGKDTELSRYLCPFSSINGYCKGNHDSPNKCRPDKLVIHVHLTTQWKCQSMSYLLHQARDPYTNYSAVIAEVERIFYLALSESGNI